MKRYLVICVVTVVIVGSLIGSYLLGKHSVEVLNEQAIEKVAMAKENDICQSIMYILNDQDSLSRLTELDPEEYRTKITSYGPYENVYYTNYGGHIRVSTEQPAWER